MQEREAGKRRLEGGLDDSQPGQLLPQEGADQTAAILQRLAAEPNVRLDAVRAISRALPARDFGHRHGPLP